MNDNITNTNFEIINKAKDCFFSASTSLSDRSEKSNRYEILLGLSNKVCNF